MLIASQQKTLGTSYNTSYNTSYKHHIISAMSTCSFCDELGPDCSNEHTGRIITDICSTLRRFENTEESRHFAEHVFDSMHKLSGWVYINYNMFEYAFDWLLVSEWGHMCLSNHKTVKSQVGEIKKHTTYHCFKTSCGLQTYECPRSF